MNQEDTVFLKNTAYRLDGYAESLDDMGMALDALYLREESARLRTIAGDPNSWAALDAKYGITSEGEAAVEQYEPPSEQ